MEYNIESSKCCGCGACKFVCSKGAIRLKEDKYGFVVAEIDEDLCVKCGACKKVCPFENRPLVNNTLLTAYAGANKNSSAIKEYASGGIFYTIAQCILSEGGIVYGTAYDTEFNVKVIFAETKEDLKQMLGSKYVQSSLADAFSYIRQDLETNRTVLFCGTPCQVAALRNVFGKYENLFLIDIVCHGTPNNRFFKDYISFLQKKNGYTVKELRFRDKKYGQDTKGSIVIKTKDKLKRIPLFSFESSYYSLFLKGAIFRESCYQCPYASKQRVGDISICDFWGIDQHFPEVHRELRQAGLNTISGIVVNTEKGTGLIQKVNEDLFLKPVSYEGMRKENPQLNAPFKMDSQLRATFLSLYVEKGYAAVDKCFHKEYRTSIIIRRIARLFPKSVVKAVVAIKEKVK